MADSDFKTYIMDRLYSLSKGWFSSRFLSQKDKDILESVAHVLNDDDGTIVKKIVAYMPPLEV